jgi:hypothetical protein
MFCTQCGTRINEGERFCTKCGTRSRETVAVEAGAVVKPIATPVAPEASAAAAVAGSMDSSELASTEAAASGGTPQPAAASPAAPAPPFRMFGVEMGEHAAEEPAAIAPSSGDVEPVTKTSSGLGAAFWFAAFVVVVLGTIGFFAWTMLSSRASSISVRVDPVLVQIKAGASTPLSATVAGDPDSSVTWTVMEGPGSGFVRSTGITAAGGKVAASAEYMAPLKPGTYHVLATSTKDKKQGSSAEIVVSP